MANWMTHTRMTPFGSQERAFRHLMKKNVGALFSDPGTGKTKLALDMSCDRIMDGHIDTIVVFAWPSQIHEQWVVEQIPKHWWDGINLKSYFWDGKKLPKWFQDSPAPGEAHLMAFNIETTRSNKAMGPLLELFKKRGNRIQIIIDESQTIKNVSTEAWKGVNSLALYSKYKLIMTGTPIAKSLTDEWAQYRFLDEKIIGIKYKTAFEQQFCILGGRNNQQFIGPRNLELFNTLVAPYSFRSTKAELGLPPKMPPDEMVFHMTTEQRLAQEALRETFVIEYNMLREQFDTQVPMDEILRVSNVGSMMVKLQQIVSGYVTGNDGEVHDLKENPRLDMFEQFHSIRDDKMVVWCRFRKDIENIKARLGDKVVMYYGGVNDAEKRESKRKFLNDDTTRIFAANAASAGSGMDGLQTVCTRAAYYSHTFNLIDRIQSEDRTNRVGTTDTSLYYDFIARGGIDRFMLRNIRRKRSFSDLALGDLKELIDEISA